MFFRAIRPLLPLIPIGILVVGLATSVLAWVRLRRGVPLRVAVARSALDVLATASVLGILLLTLPPSIEATRTLDLVPFRDLGRDTARTQMLANVVMFVPLGLFLPARVRLLDGAVRIVLFAAAMSLAIEVVQFVFDLGRQTSITDVILNTARAALGYLLLTAARALLTRRRASARRSRR
jgi:glycopeptide antibiotics resistance protein